MKNLAGQAKTKNMKNKILASVVALSAVVGLAFAGSVSAAVAPQNWGGQRGAGQGQFTKGARPEMPGVFGTVSTISGTTLTVTSKGFGSSTVATTYTVDASNATVMDKGATSTLSSIAVGNSIMVSGTVSGTSVTATKINVGMGNIGFGGAGMGGRNASSTANRIPRNASSTNMMVGNGQPIIGGTVSAISGTTITITNKGNITYTIDASSATVTKGNSSSSVSNIAVGDSVLVQGTINGTSVTATTITDQAPAKATNSKPSIGGFFGGIGNFFSKLFGF